ncbi:hypothetical protein GALL_299160 [mine drainage metagenome]|uniref:Class I SAM-dependent methyltransferase n=1 Tax=mine drainage metagenome TaxID=410659 RepID=A0A1J5QXB9_9ZZZZ
MIDVVTYRQTESLARQSGLSWRAMQAQLPHVFNSSGFPVKVDAVGELKMLVDTMQENRFEPYMRELGGLSDAEMDVFVAALGAYMRWYAGLFGGGMLTVPLSTMLAHYALYRKISRFGQYGRILEVGPGCGYLSFYLQGDERVTSYCQVEVTESFYLLQSLLNHHLYGEGFADHAKTSLDLKNTELLTPSLLSGLYDSEQSAVLDYRPSPRCEHFPWWRLGDLLDRQFDVITSNANFNEMSEPAFITYATLFSRILAPEGIVLAQCLGGGPLPVERIVRVFESLGFAVLMLTDAVAGNPLTVKNFILVKEGHPSFAAQPRPLQQLPQMASEYWLYNMFDRSQGGVMRSRDEVLSAVQVALSGG